MTGNQESYQKLENLRGKLSVVKETLLETLKIYQRLEEKLAGTETEMVNNPKYDIRQYSVAVEVIKEKIKLCQLNLQILEIEEIKISEDCKKQDQNLKRIQELEEKLKEATNKLLMQEMIKKKMETTFKEFEQRKTEQVKTLLESINKYMNQINDDTKSASGRSLR